jgi:hypothetical protein
VLNIQAYNQGIRVTVFFKNIKNKTYEWKSFPVKGEVIKVSKFWCNLCLLTCWQMSPSVLYELQWQIIRTECQIGTLNWLINAYLNLKIQHLQVSNLPMWPSCSHDRNVTDNTSLIHQNIQLTFELFQCVSYSDHWKIDNVTILECKYFFSELITEWVELGGVWHLM